MARARSPFLSQFATDDLGARLMCAGSTSTRPLGAMVRLGSSQVLGYAQPLQTSGCGPRASGTLAPRCGSACSMFRGTWGDIDDLGVTFLISFRGAKILATAVRGTDRNERPWGLIERFSGRIPALGLLPEAYAIWTLRQLGL